MVVLCLCFRTFKKECPAQLYVSSDRKSGQLVVKKLNTDHNHEVSSDLKMMYPSQRRLEGDLLETAKTLTQLRTDVKVLREYLQTKKNKCVTLKDLHNLRAAISPDETEAGALMKVLEDFLQEDEGGRLALVVNEESTLEALFLQTSAMADSFHKFPEIIFIDSTYSTNNLNMPLFTRGERSQCLDSN